jgi:hypothetical protein
MGVEREMGGLPEMVGYVNKYVARKLCRELAGCFCSGMGGYAVR